MGAPYFGRNYNFLRLILWGLSLAPYSNHKRGVFWARELARHNIRVAAIAPGVFETDMVASIKPEARDRFIQAVPLRRTGALEELIDAVNFIIKNDYYTDRVMELDGGVRL